MLSPLHSPSDARGVAGRDYRHARGAVRDRIAIRASSAQVPRLRRGESRQETRDALNGFLKQELRAESRQICEAQPKSAVRRASDVIRATNEASPVFSLSVYASGTYDTDQVPSRCRIRRSRTPDRRRSISLRRRFASKVRRSISQIRSTVSFFRSSISQLRSSISIFRNTVAVSQALSVESETSCRISARPLLSHDSHAFPLHATIRRRLVVLQPNVNGGSEESECSRFDGRQGKSTGLESTTRKPELVERTRVIEGKLREKGELPLDAIWICGHARPDGPPRRSALSRSTVGSRPAVALSACAWRTYERDGVGAGVVGPGTVGPGSLQERIHSRSFISLLRSFISIFRSSMSVTKSLSVPAVMGGGGVQSSHVCTGDLPSPEHVSPGGKRPGKRARGGPGVRSSNERSMANGLDLRRNFRQLTQRTGVTRKSDTDLRHMRQLHVPRESGQAGYGRKPRRCK